MNIVIVWHDASQLVIYLDSVNGPVVLAIALLGALSFSRAFLALNLAFAAMYPSYYSVSFCTSGILVKTRVYICSLRESHSISNPNMVGSLVTRAL